MGAVSGLNRGLTRLQTAVLLTAVCSAGCAVEDEPNVERYGLESVVSDYFTSTCSTSVVLGLSLQIADEVGCMAPGTLERFDPTDGIVFSGSAVIPYLTPQAKADLLAAAAAYGDELRINSGYRTVAQQYLLRKWYERGRCGITAAALPGNSNHESGRALDVGNYGTWSGRLPAYHWQQTVPGDAVHFDHVTSPDLRGSDVLAFQRLWNRNHPGDPIDEDGIYGPQTDARLAMSPAEGFAVGSTCGPDEFDGNLVATDVPDVIAAGDRVVAWVEVENTGTTTWQPNETLLGTSGPMDRDSDLYDQENWVSPNRPTGVDAPTAPGSVGRFSFMAHAPELDQDATLSEQFRLVQEGVTWFGPDIAINVSIDADDGFDPAPPDDLDGDGVDDAPGENEPGAAPVVQGGCSAGGTGGSPWLVLCAACLLAVRRRRPR